MAFIFAKKVENQIYKKGRTRPGQVLNDLERSKLKRYHDIDFTSNKTR